MNGNIIDGTNVSNQIKESLKREISEFVEVSTIRPGLAVVLVGSRKDSVTYVSMKRKACALVGIDSFPTELPEDTSQEEIEAVVDRLNFDPQVHGILVQLPLPKHLDEHAILSRILPSKDVDGLHPISIGNLVLGEPCFHPCTPAGCIELIKSIGVSMEGSNAVVIGRSNIVGKPMSLLLLAENATVTVCHSKTKNLENIVRNADIVVVAVGKAELVKGSWIKEGAVVIDVGINAVDDSTKKRGYRLVGDVEFSSVSERAGFITPVPGGVGPMTIAMLLRNTFQSAKIYYDNKN